MKLAALTLIPFFAIFLFAQDEQISRTETHTSTTTTTTYNGTLVDAGCRSSHTEESHTTTIGVSSHTETTKINSVDCPVTPATSSFGLITPDGRYIRFDQSSNTRITEIVKNNKSWNKSLRDRTPIRVHVVGSPNGDAVVMESIH